MLFFNLGIIRQNCGYSGYIGRAHSGKDTTTCNIVQVQAGKLKNKAAEINFLATWGSGSKHKSEIISFG